MKYTYHRFVWIGIFCLYWVFLAFQTSTKTITIKGSDTMLILVQSWTEAFMKEHPGISIQVTGGGTGAGMDELISGVVDVCAASRQMSKGEIVELKQRFSIPGVEIPCARDGITIYLNEQNPVSTLTFDQISGIFAGRITSWNQVGGNNAPIHLYGRETNSGTYVVFKEMVVKTDYSRQCLMLPGNAAIVSAIMKDPNGIGYGGVAFAHGVKQCFVQRDTMSKAYQPTPDAMESDAYPVSRYLYLYTRNRPTGGLKTFIDWVLSREGQKMVTDLDYFPLK
jgi:phosphate transport system substrate-binding protein